MTLLNSYVVNLSWKIVSNEVKAILTPIPINNNLDGLIPLFQANI